MLARLEFRVCTVSYRCLLKKGTGSEGRIKTLEELAGREVPVPLFQQAASSTVLHLPFG